MDTDDDGNGGNFDAAVQMKDGDDKVCVARDVTAAGKVDMGAGNDQVTVVGIILDAGKVLLGTGDDEGWFGGVADGGLLDAADGQDKVTI
ncbi:MAG: hypothetical protein IE914_10595 [Thiotrichales bacterium]|nr:hypothetical protein [Thiotrichales bacterium]